MRRLGWGRGLWSSLFGEVRVVGAVQERWKDNRPTVKAFCKQ